MKTYLHCLFLLLLCSACHPTDELELLVEQDLTPLFVSGQIKGPDEAAFSDFRIDFSTIDALTQTSSWHGNVSEGELGSTYLFRHFDTSLPFISSDFGLQFWSATLPSDRDWTPEELDAFFSIGTQFDFGQGPGKVEISLHLPLGGPYQRELSRPSFLADPQGSLEIVSVSDYEYQLLLGGAVPRSFGKLIQARFSGQIGLYDQEADYWDGDTNFFQPDEVVELRDCELVFYLEYGRD